MCSGGQLYADVTTGYGPECFTIRGKPKAYPYTLQAHYYSRGQWDTEWASSKWSSTTVVIGESGEVSEAKATIEGTLPQEIADCVIGVIQKINFPEVAGGLGDVRYPFDFTASSP